MLVVALGASNTAGYGLVPKLAYPAALERLLRARGIAVTIKNAGVSGHTTGQMLERLDRDVPEETRVVIFQPGSNDARIGIGDAVTQANITRITQILHCRGIPVLRVATAFEAATLGNLQGDGIHFTERGHEMIAEGLVAEVTVALTGVQRCAD